MSGRRSPSQPGVVHRMADARYNVSAGAGTKTSHAEFLRAWERDAPLSEQQRDACAALESEAASLFQANGAPVVAANAPALSSDGGAPDKSDVAASHDEDDDDDDESSSCEAWLDLGTLRDIRTAEDFYLWYDGVGRALERANEQRYRGFLERLESDRAAAAELTRTIDSVDERLEKLRQRRTQARRLLGDLRADCEAVVSERRRLADTVDAIRDRLRYFEELDTLTSKLGGMGVPGLTTGPPRVSPASKEFLPLLHRLDECVAYAAQSAAASAAAAPSSSSLSALNRGGGGDVESYHKKFLELQRRAVTLIRDYIIGTLKKVSATVQREVSEARQAHHPYAQLPDNEGSRAFLRFRQAASDVNTLARELRAEHRQARYAPLFAECERCYVEQRSTLIMPSVRAHLAGMAEMHGVVELARSGVAFVMRVCALERTLYRYFFGAAPSSDDDDDAAQQREADGGTSVSPVVLQLLESVLAQLTEQLRPRILQQVDLDTLVELIEVLRTEVLHEQVPRRAGGAAVSAAFRVPIQRLIADAQERAIYRAQLMIRDSIGGFRPTPADVDYPRIIEERRRRRRQRQRHGEQAAGEGEAEAAAPSEAPEASDERDDKDATAVRRDLYATWYPPVERTLRILSRLYRCVDAQVFSGLAQEAVAACIENLHRGATMIAKRDEGAAAAVERPPSPSSVQSPRPATRSATSEHSELFLVWQLSTLREQIMPFDVDFVFTERHLVPAATAAAAVATNFAELRHGVQRIIRGEVNLGRLFGPASDLVVRVESHDSKLLLEHELKRAYEAVVLRTTRRVLEPLLTWLAKVAAYSEISTAMRAQESSFASVTRVRQMWQAVERAVDEQVGGVRAAWRLYLGDDGEADDEEAEEEGGGDDDARLARHDKSRVMGEAVRDHASEAMSELLSALQTHYTLEERRQIGIDATRTDEMMRKLARL